MFIWQPVFLLLPHRNFFLLFLWPKYFFNAFLDLKKSFLNEAWALFYRPNDRRFGYSCGGPQAGGGPPAKPIWRSRCRAVALGATGEHGLFSACCAAVRLQAAASQPIRSSTANSGCGWTPESKRPMKGKAVFPALREKQRRREGQSDLRKRQIEEEQGRKTDP